MQVSLEELLRADVVAAQKMVEAVRDAVATNEVTQEEARRLQKVAQRRQVAAMQRFSAFVVDGVVPEDLQP